MYNGNYAGHHYSGLTQIDPANAAQLGLSWVFQARSLEKFESTPVVIDGVMYVTEAPNNVVALDPVSGHIPGAINRFFKNNLAADGRFKPAIELKNEFAKPSDSPDPDSYK